MELVNILPPTVQQGGGARGGRGRHRLRPRPPQAEHGAWFVVATPQATLLCSARLAAGSSLHNGVGRHGLGPSSPPPGRSPAQTVTGHGVHSSGGSGSSVPGAARGRVPRLLSGAGGGNEALAVFRAGVSCLSSERPCNDAMGQPGPDPQLAR